ncbi:MAG: lecithin retinol acyltransferase family protein [Ruminococcus sp.]
MLKRNSIRDFEEKWEYKKPEAGDQVRVKRTGYYHHGIYTGQSVIQFGEGDSESDMLHCENNDVNETSLGDFLKGGLLEVRVYSKKELKLKNSPEETVRIAREHLGEKGYHFIRNNCEHFSNLCAFNEKISLQAEAQLEDIRNRIKKADGKRK